MTASKVRPLRIAQVGSQVLGPDSRGGIATVISLILQHPDPQVQQTHVVTYGDVPRQEQLRLFAGGLARLVSLLANRDVDVVHVHMSFKGSVVRKVIVLRLARMAGVPTVLHTHSHCGGFGMRMRDGVEDLPKPMAMVGNRPLIWHVMRYYAHFGHKEFILAMGYGARHISRYFAEYDETHSNDFVIEGGKVTPLTTDVADWKITFVHTGIETPIGERLRRVADHLGDDEYFMANYADVLTDAPLDKIIDRFRSPTPSPPSSRYRRSRPSTSWTSTTPTTRAEPTSSPASGRCRR